MTYSKLANLHIVNTKRFFLLASAQTQRRHELADEVERAEDKTRADEAVGAAADGVGKLVA